MYVLSVVWFLLNHVSKLSFWFGLFVMFYHIYVYTCIYMYIYTCTMYIGTVLIVVMCFGLNSLVVIPLIERFLYTFR